MSEIAVRQDYLPAQVIPAAAQGLVEWAHSADAAYELAKRIVTTSFAPAQYRGKPDEAAAAMLAGAEVGLSPMAALRAFDVIQGVAAPRAITLRAIVQSFGHQIVYTEQSPTKVVAQGMRRGSNSWQTVEWTIQRAQQLGLTGKDQWKKQPQTMLVARATAECARLIAADAILGIPYSVEEIIDDTPVPTTMVARSEAKPRTVRRKQQPEPVEPEFDPEPDPEPEPPLPVEDLITDSQTKKMMALFHEKGFRDRSDRLAYVTEVVGIEVSTSKDLTKSQASRVIDALDRLADVEQVES